MLKKLFFIPALAVGLFLTEANAQSLSVGPRLGVNFSHVAFTEGNINERHAQEADQENLAGAQIGAVINLGLTDMFSLQPEILYSQKGRRHEGYFRATGPYEYRLQRNYLEIPILIKATFGSENLHAFLNAGPYLAYLLSGRNNYLIGGNEAEYELDMKYHNGVKPNRSDAGLAIGGGLGSKLGPGNLELEVRYSHGFSDLKQYEPERDPYWPKMANRTIGVSVSYLIPLQ